MAERRPSAFVAPAIVWFSWFVLIAGANLATPLYGVYAKRFAFSSLVLTSVFATYAFVLVPSLILFGRLSDRLGRRPVILAGLAVACVALLLFALAEATAWLFVARALQGLAVGMISGPATAALVELDPADDRRRAALLAGLAQAGGSAAGPLAAGVLAQWAPAPLRLCFLVGLVLTLAAAVAILLRLPGEPGRADEPWRIQWPRVPAALRGRFARVSLTAAIAWAVAALYLSLVPVYAARLLQTSDLALLAGLAALALAVSFGTQLVLSRRRPSPRRHQALGLAALALGLVLLGVAAPAHSLALLVAGGILTGVGHGLAFLNAQEELNDLAPPERRGEVSAAFVGCIYFVVATGVISAGILDLRLSLAHSVGLVAACLAALALAAAAWQILGRSD